MDKSWMRLDRLDVRYQCGINDFLEFALDNAGEKPLHYCPCNRCQCRSYRVRFSIDKVQRHLNRFGFWDKYTCWIYHGETSTAGRHDHGQFVEIGSSSNDPTLNLINDLFPNESGIFTDQAPNVPPVFDELPHIEPVFQQLPRAHITCSGMDKYNNLIMLQRTPLYDGCSKTVLECILGVMEIKMNKKMSIEAVDSWLKLTASILPLGHRLPTTHRKMRHILKYLGLSYIKIHACRYDCVLFYGKDLEDLEACPVCGTERYKLTPAGNKKAVKILRYFPLIDRLERLFMCAHTAEAMRWWAERNVPNDDTLRHPADGEAWKYIAREYSDFSSEIRNVWLGLSSDGFNPFGNMSLKYSIWPVILVPYNLPPWMCMKKEYNMLTLLIPGPGYPGKCLDVYLRPLIDELKYLSDIGHATYDKFKNEMFQMRAMLIGTISDFPARGMLSGTVTKGYKACPECMSEEFSSSHCRKIVYMRHRCWLPENHSFRKDRIAFDGTVETCEKSEGWTGEDILKVLNEYNFGPLSNHPDVLARIPERPDKYKFWTHKSIFWELPYWPNLPIRNYLDVMHIEKNVCESVVGTVLNWEGKTKDGPKARDDLKKMGLRKHLWLKENNRKMPQAHYTVKPNQKHEILRWMSNIRYPYGYAGNINKCVTFQDNKISGLKSHDCHVLLQRLFPIFIRGYLPNDVVEPLVALSRFFQKLCAREVTKSEIEGLQYEIILIMCKLETIFPPNFFDIMPHLMIHLPEQVWLTGPVHYTWMYPMERQLGYYKDFVKNTSAPEGSIAEAYIAHECVTYTKLYLGACEDPPQHMSLDKPDFNLSIISNDVEVHGLLPKSFELKRHELVIAHWHVLINCPEVQFWKNYHLHSPQVGGDVQYHNKSFANYYGKWMNMVENDGHTEWSHALRLLAMKPVDSIVYSMCKVNGVRYTCQSRDDRLKTQNCGVMVHGGQDGVDYYGVLLSVVELIYGEAMKVYLFKCKWFDTCPENTITDQYGIFSVNTATTWYEDDPFVLATSVKQVFYIDDLKHKGTWKVVNHVVPRNIYSAGTLGVTADNNEVTAYQEPNTCDIPKNDTIQDNIVRSGIMVGISEAEDLDVNPNETDDDSGDEERHILPEINYDTSPDSSDEDDSDYLP